MKTRFALLLALLQGLYFVVTGVWPLLDIRSFMRVTGPKTDLWLVRTVGVLILAIGLALLSGWRRKRIGFELWLVAILSAVGLAAIDIVYFVAGVLSPVYLLDVAAEIGIAVCWGIIARRRPEEWKS